MSDLFEEELREVRLGPGAMLLGGLALRFEAPCMTRGGHVPASGLTRPDRVNASWIDDKY